VNNIIAKNILGAFQKGREHLVPKQIQVTNANGKTFTKTVYVNPNDTDQKDHGAEKGDALSPDIAGMQITKYSDKALLITGDTYVNKDDLRSVKEEVGVGSWNRKLQGWVFPIKFLDRILGSLSSKQAAKGNSEKATAITNQKNESLNKGDNIQVGGESATVTEGASTSEGVKYNVSLSDGTTLTGVDEKVITKTPEKDDEKVSNIINNVTPENRAKVKKTIFGIKPIENLHEYTLEDYMKLHGLSDSDIQSAIKMVSTPSSGGEKKSRGPSSSRSENSKRAKKDEALSKRQLALKLIHRHRQAVKNAILSNKEVSQSVMRHYPDLAQNYRNMALDDIGEEVDLTGGTDLETGKLIDNTPMSEETKRKISEALKGRGGSKIDELKNQLRLLKESLQKKNDRASYLKEKIGKVPFSEATKLREEYRSIEIHMAEKELRVLEGKVECLNNGGSLVQLTDKVGDVHEDIPDYTSVLTDNIEYDSDTILNKERPLFIPNLDQRDFKSKGFMPDVAKIGNDRYLISLGSYEEDMGGGNVNPDRPKKAYDVEQGYAILTLDQLALTQEYFIERQKALNKQQAKESNERVIARWFRIPEATRKRTLDKVTHRYLSAKLKKKFSPDQWNSMEWQEKEKHYQHVKLSGVKRVVSVWNNKKKKNFMPTSFHSMHERFVNPENKRFQYVGGSWQRVGGQKINVGGQKSFLERTQRPKGYGTSYGNQEVFEDWRNIKQMFEWKLSDLKIEREDMSEMRAKAIETSYGESGTESSLVDTHGIKTKRQNGDIINPDQIDQIKKHWESIQSKFAPLREMAKRDGLKISHSGKKLMFARKAVGLYASSMMTIGVSNKHGDGQFGSTFAHEVAHYMDNSLGKSQGKRFASNDYESSAGRVAIALKKGMNNIDKANNYYQSTHECFARAMQQYFTIESGDPDDLNYFDQPFYASKSLYENQIKPNIEAFLKENSSFFKAMNAYKILGIEG